MSAARPKQSLEFVMELKGYIPRVGATTAKPVERCLTPTLLADDTPLPELAMVDGWWAATDTDSLAALRRARVGVLLDTQAWRMTTPDVLEMPKANQLPHLPTLPSKGVPDQTFDDFVRRDIEFQMSMDVAAIILPGRIPQGPKDDVWPWINRSIEVATTVGAVDRPMLGMVGLHSQRLISDAERTAQLSRALTGVILQVTPFNPLKMRPASLMRAVEAIDMVREAGFEVVLRSGAGLGSLIQALGLGLTRGGWPMANPSISPASSVPDGTSTRKVAAQSAADDTSKRSDGQSRQPSGQG